MEKDELLKIVPDEKPDKMRLAIGIVPSRIHESRVTWEAWSVIRKIVEEFAENSNGEYTSWHVLRAIDSGEVNLGMVYVNDTGKDLSDIEQQAFMWDRLLRDKEKGFAGYFLTRIESTNIHIWHAYIVKEYRSSEVFNIAFDRIKLVAKTLGAPSLTFSSNRESWGAVCERLGFDEVNTTYRMRLDK